MVLIADEISLSPPDTAARPRKETHMSPWVQQVTKTIIITQHKTTTKKKKEEQKILTQNNIKKKSEEEKRCGHNNNKMPRDRDSYVTPYLIFVTNPTNIFV